MLLFLRYFKLTRPQLLLSFFAASLFTPIAMADTATPSQPSIALDVYKDANCGCCNAWIEHANEHGFDTQGHNISRLYQFKLSKGIAGQHQSCHTAISNDGYVFEGHVPARFVHQFLDNPPQGAIGLSVPAMPMGSPGMEYQNQFDPYQVLLLMEDGSTKVYANITSLEESLRH